MDQISITIVNSLCTINFMYSFITAIKAHCKHVHVHNFVVTVQLRWGELSFPK